MKGHKSLSRHLLCSTVGFCTGGTAYALLEILWRGYTHISMFLVGGTCFLFLLLLMRTRLSFGMKCLTGSLVIGVVELVAGCIINLWLRLEVWDYTAEAFDLYGQICPRFLLLWGVLCAAIFGLHDLARAIAEKMLPRLQLILQTLSRYKT